MHSEEVVIARVAIVDLRLLDVPLTFPLLLCHALIFYVAVFCEELVKCQAYISFTMKVRTSLLFPFRMTDVLSILRLFQRINSEVRFLAEG